MHLSFLDNSWQVMSCFLVFLLGVGLSLFAGRRFGLTYKASAGLYFWHLIFSIVYAVYVNVYGGDAVAYYLESNSGNLGFYFGTSALRLFTSLFTYYAGMSFLGVSLFFNLIGTVGLLAFYGSLRVVVEGHGLWARRLALLIVLLPSVNFWSSAIGKDSVTFMCVGLVLWASMEFQRRYLAIFISIAIVFVIRPHMAGFMTLAFCLMLAANSQISMRYRLFLGVAGSVAAIFMVPLVLHYVGLSGQPDLADVAAYLDQRQTYNLTGGGAIDISSMSLPVKMFTYLFRPLPFEAHSLFQLASSIDNVLLLLVFILAAPQLIKLRIGRYLKCRTFLWSYSLVSWVVLAYATANMGISARQKWMFLPMFLLLFMSEIGARRKRCFTLGDEASAAFSN